MTTLPITLPGLTISCFHTNESSVQLAARSLASTARCPDCGQPSSRIHSRYARRLRDLPIGERALRLVLQLRRFFCVTPSCPRQTFAERLPDFAPPHAQRTLRFTRALRTLGFALGGEAGARVATQLQLPTSGATLLRVVRASPTVPFPAPKVVGVDDFAFRKGRTYGTLLVDLERRQRIAVLPDRSAASTAAWLRAHPDVQVVARDRASEYVRGVADGAPQAVQVVDRFHLLGNLREAVERYLVRIRPELRRLLAGESGTGTRAPNLPALELPQRRYRPTARVRQEQTARHALRQQRFDQVQHLAARGLNNRQIAARVGVSTATIRHWRRHDHLPPERRGYRATGKIDAYVDYLRARLAEGCTNQTVLWREICDQGFTGTRSLVSKWLRQQAEWYTSDVPTAVAKLPSAKRLSWMLWHAPDALKPDEDRLWQQLAQHAVLTDLHTVVQQFVAMVRHQRADRLEAWLTGAQTSAIDELRSFATWLHRDYDAVYAALSMRWSTGPVEGHINRLKLIKRSGYGRMKFDLLRQRVLYAA